MKKLEICDCALRASEVAGGDASASRVMLPATFSLLVEKWSGTNGTDLRGVIGDIPRLFNGSSLLRDFSLKLVKNSNSFKIFSLFG